IGEWLQPADEEVKQREEIVETNYAAILEASTSVVFYAHPSLHQYPWTVEERIKNKHVSKGLKRQAFERFRTELRGGIGVVIERLETQAKQDQWQCGLQQQRPKQLWSHDHSLTPYQ
ncbi:hypothetical protein PHYSODRAFT_456993, partial [Phytophthora sojae]